MFLEKIIKEGKEISRFTLIKWVIFKKNKNASIVKIE
jgi:hypothetical protein